MSPPMTGVTDWQNFYVIVGSSAAGLTGLTFVVIALAADAVKITLTGLRTFTTPIVVHFGSVLWVAAMLCIPGHTVRSLAILMLAGGAAGTGYAAMTTYRMIRYVEYQPVAADWIWNAVLPLLANLGLLLGGVLIALHSSAALYLIAVVSLLLLYIGIHNAWDLAVWFTAERPGARQSAEASAAAAANPQAPSAAGSGAATTSAAISASDRGRPP